MHRKFPNRCSATNASMLNWRKLLPYCYFMIYVIMNIIQMTKNYSDENVQKDLCIGK